MSFEDIIGRIISMEGGYVADSRDPGGETKYGISKRSYPDVNIRALTRDQAVAIYKRDYWAKIKGDMLPPRLAYQVLDASVNHGVSQAVKWLQKCVGANPDGIIGPLTIASANTADSAVATMLFNAERIDFYTSLTTFSVYGKGWTRRIAHNLRYAAED